MRLPRLLAYYRAYPEFDGYSDEQCRKLLLQARLRRGDAAWVLPLLAAGGFAAAWSVIALGLVRIAAALLGLTLTGESTLLGVFMFVTPAFIVVYSWVRRSMLVRSVRRLVNRAACPFCEFSLVGLPVKINTVRCPECGEKVRLSEHGIRHEDLRPGLPYPPSSAGEWARRA
ncbi:MAG: hypothetical protein KF699_15440 [Phycisphaeraceae bacterium]|nr:hypothetical protein [Phycisphaeraceae bacterium]